MKRFDIEIDIDASPARVWAVMRDLERWPEWTSTMLSVQLLDAAPVGVGTRVRVRQPKLAPAEWHITEWTPDRGFTWVSRQPGAQATGRHAIEPRGPGSRVTLSLEFAGVLGVLVGFALSGLVRRYITIEAQGLKTRSEA